MNTLLISATTITGLAAVAFLINRRHSPVVESKLAGLWMNQERTMRILIYTMGSFITGELVWSSYPNAARPGSNVFRDLRVDSHGNVRGMFIDPLTREQMPLELKVRNTGLSLHLMSEKDRQDRTETWFPVKT